jgi:hypothetical protein
MPHFAILDLFSPPSQTTHDKVKKRALVLIAMWAGEFENNPSLGIMEECYTGLKARGAFPDLTFRQNRLTFSRLQI